MPINIKPFVIAATALALSMIACAGPTPTTSQHDQPNPELLPPFEPGQNHELAPRRPYGHAHNDYEHARPLTTALTAGALAIEADVHLVDGQLLVAHDADEVDPNKTIQSLYLDPLFQRFTTLGGINPAHPFNGRVRESSLPVVLMIDFKTDGDDAWPVLESILYNYPGLARTIHRDHNTGNITVVEGPVIIAISGNRPDIDSLRNARIRRTAIDGGLFVDLQNEPAHLYPMVSASDNMALDQSGGSWSPGNTALQSILRTAANKAALEGRLSRIWGAPDSYTSWDIQLNAGITLINNDDPIALEAYITSQLP